MTSVTTTTRRAHSLSPTHTRSQSDSPPYHASNALPAPLSQSPSPLPAPSAQPGSSRTFSTDILRASKVARAKASRYTPYHPSKLSVNVTGNETSSSGSGSGSDSGEGAGSSGTEGSGHRRSRRGDASRDLRPLSNNDSNTLPIASHLSRLALNKPSPVFNPPLPRSKAAARFAHRRTKSLSTQPSYGYILLPQAAGTSPTTTTFPRRHSASPPQEDPGSFTNDTHDNKSVVRFSTDHIPRIDVTLANSSTISVNMPPSPRPPTPTSAGRNTALNRMMLVNPAIAAHLKKGGVVTMRTPDGMKRWRIRLPLDGSTGPVPEEDITAGRLAAMAA